MPLLCPYCGAIREPLDDHYLKCPQVRMAFDPRYHPRLESIRARNAEKRRGRATGKSGDGGGWRKRFGKAKR